MSLALRFLGVGSAQAPELGSACAVVERDGLPLLMIDCGAEALSIYLDHYGVERNVLYGAIAISIIAVATAGLVIDLIYPLLDPRIRHR